MIVFQPLIFRGVYLRKKTYLSPSQPQGFFPLRPPERLLAEKQYHPAILAKHPASHEYLKNLPTGCLIGMLIWFMK